MQKLYLTFIVIGSVLVAGSIFILLSTLGQNRDSDVVSLGAMAFSFGCMMVAGGLYLKSKTADGSIEALKEDLLPAAKASPKAKKVSAQRAERKACDRCRAEAELMRCLRHGLSLCSQCLRLHDREETCSYRPLLAMGMVAGRR